MSEKKSKADFIEAWKKEIEAELGYEIEICRPVPTDEYHGREIKVKIYEEQTSTENLVPDMNEIYPLCGQEKMLDKDRRLRWFSYLVEEEMQRKRHFDRIQYLIKELLTDEQRDKLKKYLGLDKKKEREA